MIKIRQNYFRPEQQLLYVYDRDPGVVVDPACATAVPAVTTNCPGLTVAATVYK